MFYMHSNAEISALLILIDDPDEEVFYTVSNRIVHYGKGIIPNLEKPLGKHYQRSNTGTY